MEIVGMRRNVNKLFWKGKRVFLTGHTGFKGSWMSLWLQSMGSTVKGYALEPPTNPSLFSEAEVWESMDSEIGDIRDLEKIKKSMFNFDPDILIHMAAQPLVRLSYEEPIETYSTNVMGTVNVLEAARYCPNLRSIVSVTTDKCYENQEWHWGYRENEPMGGHDPYSSSKGCAELVTSAYRRSFFSGEKNASVASVRAGNVIGGGDWASDRLIPDILRAFEKSEPIIIRNPHALRPWQHVMEPLSGYLMLAESLYEKGQVYAEAWNFGPEDGDVKDVEWITRTLCDLRGNKKLFKVDINPQPHEANFLKLDCSKAKVELGWQPKWNIEMSLKSITEWFQLRKEGGDVRLITENQIKQYINS